MEVMYEIELSDTSLISTTMAPPNRRGNAHKGGARRAENNRIYANPLPIVFEDIYSSRFSSILSFLGINTRRCVNPHCEGIFDPTTRSVWITNARDTSILWQRGFFGKGDLSRSEPSWLSRQINLRKSKGKGESFLMFKAHADLQASQG
jgi:tRNA-splicing endonuclease subunit Sen2